MPHNPRRYWGRPGSNRADFSDRLWAMFRTIDRLATTPADRSTHDRLRARFYRYGTLDAHDQAALRPLWRTLNRLPPV